MINPPKEIFRIWVNNGKNKAALPALNMYLLGILAGLFIGFGCHVFVLATAADPGVIGKLIGAALFPVGLMLVIFCGAELFTGNNLMTLALMSKEISLPAMLKNWGIVYLGNLTGSVLLAFLLVKSGLYAGRYAVQYPGRSGLLVPGWFQRDERQDPGCLVPDHAVCVRRL